ncbi:LysR substrate-binding domain-containing protein [Pseudomonas sp. WJP1]|uniref:LysR substrate-binding domain-containing protein n=1 Tax=Pseudomonas sp. WJP1 TaxID=2986947 RepID=UPI00234A125B|nr:LysR substrate-binding domain-containing protein [Pseudomonas sp. WJP1]WCM49196.1 LysR substrate-binding domain-containing protein [Pseudomonas sp. WJP1]
MLDLKDVFYFVQVVDRGGFTAAGNSLRLPKSTLSHRVQELETYLGVRLLNRTSRQFGMTDIGIEFYQYAIAMLNSADVAEEAVRQRLSEPSGVVRITTAVEIAQFALRDLLPIFLTRYPKVQIVEISTDRLVDIVGEGFDLAIRGHISPLQDSSLVQRAIASVPWFLFAGAQYLEKAGTPATPEELAQHASISIVRGGPVQWQLRGPSGQETTVPLTPRFQSNDMISTKEAACANLGIAALPGYICKEELKNGTLRRVLPGWMVADARMTALMPHRTGLLPAVRALLDFLAAEIPRLTTFDEA